MTPLYPLRFEPLFRRYIWGGHRLASVLGKPIGEESCAESWEVVDHEEDQSVVAAGPLQGTTLGELVRDRAAELLGRDQPLSRFPLLVKFLDANRALSVQVHPNDQQAQKLDPPDLGKTECWYILEAEAGSKIYAGLRTGVTRSSLRTAIENGTCEDCLATIEPRPGDCVFIPAGTVHALGAGIVLAEIQQASDVTYRLFDWNRVDADGNPRPLHIEPGIAVTDFETGPIGVQPSTGGDRETLIECEKFVLIRREVTGAQTLGGDDRFRLLLGIEGTARVQYNGTTTGLPRGTTLLIPASVGEVTIDSAERATILESHLA